jgi:hypothetical protein
MEFKNGDRVVLTTGRHGKSNKNPVWGSKYQCVGTLSNFKKSAFASLFPLRVNWDNGLTNAYDHPDLALSTTVDNDNPNFTFKRDGGTSD